MIDTHAVDLSVRRALGLVPLSRRTTTSGPISLVDRQRSAPTSRTALGQSAASGGNPPMNSGVAAGHQRLIT